MWKRKDYQNMANLPKSLRATLGEKMKLGMLAVEKVEDSDDKQTKKFLWALGDGNFVESVLILSGDRRTVCVSSQVPASEVKFLSRINSVNADR